MPIDDFGFLNGKTKTALQMENRQWLFPDPKSTINNPASGRHALRDRFAARRGGYPGFAGSARSRG
jgi:hypothetical protein